MNLIYQHFLLGGNRMGCDVVLRRRRLGGYALGASGLALGMALAPPAAAQCSPDPTIANSTTTCTGTDADGLTVTTFGTNVSVNADAVVRGAGAPAIAIRIGSDAGFGTPVGLSVAGLVDGGAAAGVSLVSQNGSSYDQGLNVTVAALGRVTGTNGIVVARGAAQSYVTPYVSIDNSGSILGTSGVALLSTDPAFGGFSSIYNRAGGVIGAIVGAGGTITNLGSIDGGDRSAIEWTATGSRFFGDITNAGTITSTSTAGTLANIPGFKLIANRGMIENRGVGAAISSGGGLSITNAATGRIASAGTTAIMVGDTIQLINAGTVVGDVLAGGTDSYSGSLIDSTAGRITGSVRFGAGADTLVGRYDGTGLQYGIDGAIDGGAGTDAIRVSFLANGTVAAPLARPTGFERLVMVPAAGVTATLAPGFVAPGTLFLGGAGTLVNAAALTGSGQIVMTDFQAAEAPSFVNTGSLVATDGTDGYFAVDLILMNRFENSGAIVAARDAVHVFASGPVVNSGTITAGGTGVSLFGYDFSNSATGVIRSTGGVGLILTGSSYGSGQSNAGRIEGAIAGVQLRSTLINSGTISSAGSGVVLSSYGVLDNRADGVVSGGRSAITTVSPGDNFSAFQNTVSNAGTINGDVIFAGIQSTIYDNNNRFFALPGGTLNGNLTLGKGDLFVTDLTNTGRGAFAGVTGNVSGSQSQVRLRVREDANASLEGVAGFATVGYDLYDGASLVLTGTSPVPRLMLAGQGSVDVTADIATGAGPAIQSTSVALAPNDPAIDTALSITSRGVLNLTRNDNDVYPGALVALGGSDRFTNAGTIYAIDRATPVYSQFAAISGGFSYTTGGGTTVVNDGTLLLSGTVGVRGVRSLTNTGSILQVAGGRAATGVAVDSFSSIRIDNQGTIDVAGVAIVAGGFNSSIVNSGRIASTADIAIDTVYSSGISVTNSATGIIQGGLAADGARRAALRLGGGSVTNAGTIVGTVDLGYSPYGGRSFGVATYTADGGTIAGDLLFGSSEDTLIAFSTLGISGAIDGGSGMDTFVQARRASDTVTLGAIAVTGFEREGVRAIGADTVVTLRSDAASAGTLSLSGDGTIVNTTTIAGKVRIENPGSFVDGTFVPEALLAGFTNEGRIADGVSGVTARLVNSGTIGSDALDGVTVSLSSPDALSFVNKGQIANNGTLASVYLSSTGTSIDSGNTGTIVGSLLAEVTRSYGDVDPASPPASISLTNSGMITGNAPSNSTVAFITFGSVPSAGILDNTGTIEALGESGNGAVLSVYGNANYAPQRFDVTNSGTIRANAGGSEIIGGFGDVTWTRTDSATALAVLSDSVFYGATAIATVINAAGGTIEAAGGRSVGIFVSGAALDLDNAGTIRGTNGTVLADEDILAMQIGTPYLAGAIQSFGATDDRIVNTGTIIGSVALGGGADRIDNLGRFEGDVFLGFGDDVFLQRASAVLIGTVDGGVGSDGLIVDATGGGAVNGDQFVNFESFSQIGEGEVRYSGNFRFDTIGVSGGTITVGEGEVLGSAGAVTVTGSDANEMLDNGGTILGGVDLGGGNDRADNRGAIRGAVSPGDGNDLFVDYPGSSVDGGVDGGAGTDLYRFAMAGDRSAGGKRTGFETIAVEGSGTLQLTLDQALDRITLAGTGLNLSLGGYGVGEVTGSDAGETLAVDGDLALVDLGAGEDTLTLASARANGLYQGGAGNDTLGFATTERVVLGGTATGFEHVSLGGGALLVMGALGTSGAPLAFGDGAQALVVAPSGRLAGVVDLGAGDDTLRLAAGATLAGTVSGGAGSDTAMYEVARDTTLAGVLSGFELLTTEGAGTLTFTGTQAYQRVAAGNDLVIASDAALSAGQIAFGTRDDSLTIAGGFTGNVDGGAGSDVLRFTSVDPVVLGGIVTGFEQVSLAGGALSVTGTLGSAGASLAFGDGAQQLAIATGGTLTGIIDLGGGNDTLRLAAGATLAGTVSGGAGFDSAAFGLTGDATLASGTLGGFEMLTTEGSGTLTLGGVQGFEQVVSGTDLTVVADGVLTAGQVQFGKRDDRLTILGRFTGNIDGGTGSDTLRFGSLEPVTLGGMVTGFEQVSLAGGALSVTGTLGSAGALLAFGDGAQGLTVARGGSLAGIIDLGAGDDTLRLVAGATLAGIVSGGAGNDAATLELAGDAALASGTLTGFEQLATEGTGTLMLTGTQAYQRIAPGGDLVVAADGIVTGDAIAFGGRDDRLTIAGRFTGGVNGGAGNDTVAVSGSAAFSTIAGIERYAQTGGAATIAGIATFGSVDLSGGQLFGAPGSRIAASLIAVARGATFGSAGSVMGDLAVAGTLSPGGSGIGTMTVNGRVALAAGSLSLFEIASTGADRLQVNGAVAIASGATLQLAPIGTVRAGTSYDLIVASGGISGAFAVVTKPETLFGFVVQRADRIQLLGQFVGSAAFSPQVSRSIDYANTVLQAQSATSSLFGAVPALLNADGTSNVRAFARVTPEAYASATQAGIDNALTLTGAARGSAFATMREDPGLFTFGETVGQWHTLGADATEGTASARTRGYGFLGGIGYGSADFAVGAFGGYLNTRQTIGGLESETKNDGFVAGVHTRYASGALGLTAAVLYDGGEARTTRALPGATRVTGRYDLHSWVGDVSASYALDMGTDWALRPKLGLTYLRTTRDGTVEAGGPFALTVARDRHNAGFVDGGLLVARSDTSTAPLRPFVGLGVRYQFEGRRTNALAAFAGGPLSLEALGASRARAVATASAGITYRLKSGLDLFSTASAQTGRDDHQETITTGLRMRF